MIIYVDVNGTILDNPAASKEQVLQALQDLHDFTGAEVQLVSAMGRNNTDLPGMQILSKTTVLAQPLSDAIMIDDEAAVLVCAVRLGAIAIPAARILDFVNLLVSAAARIIAPGYMGKE